MTRCMVVWREMAVVAFFPMPGEKRWRIVGAFPEGHEKDEGEILYEEIEARIKEEAELELDITRVDWFSTYKVHTRHVEKFSFGPMFSRRRFRAHTHSRRWTRNEYRNSGRLQSGLEAGAGSEGFGEPNAFWILTMKSVCPTPGDCCKPLTGCSTSPPVPIGWLT